MRQTIIDESRIYVLTDEDFSDRNVFCYVGDKLLWQIEGTPKLHHRNYYTSIYMNDSELYAYCKNGIEAVIDKQTGKILSSELIK